MRQFLADMQTLWYFSRSQEGYDPDLVLRFITRVMLLLIPVALVVLGLTAVVVLWQVLAWLGA
jgi:hypothetical protein